MDQMPYWKPLDWEPLSDVDLVELEADTDLDVASEPDYRIEGWMIRANLLEAAGTVSQSILDLVSKGNGFTDRKQRQQIRKLSRIARELAEIAGGVK